MPAIEALIYQVTREYGQIFTEIWEFSSTKL